MLSNFGVALQLVSRQTASHHTDYCCLALPSTPQLNLLNLSFLVFISDEMHVSSKESTCRGSFRGLLVRAHSQRQMRPEIVRARLEAFLELLEDMVAVINSQYLSQCHA